MKPKLLFKVAAVVSSVLLACGFIAYYAGLLPPIMSGTKSAFGTVGASIGPVTRTQPSPSSAPAE